MNYENVNLNSYEYSKLSNEKKLELVQARIKSIINEEADKHQMTVVYKGKKIKINKDKLGKLRDLVSRERSLEKKVKEKVRQEELAKSKEENENKANNKDNNDLNLNVPLLPAGKGDNNLKSFIEREINSDSYNAKTVEEKLDFINEKGKYINECIKKNGINSEFEEIKEYLNKLYVSLMVESISGKLSEKEDDENTFIEDNKANSEDNASEKWFSQASDLEENLNEETETSSKDSKKHNKFLSLIAGLPFIAKIKNRNNKKDSFWLRKFNKKKKRIGAAICAGIIAVTGMISLKSCNNNKDNNNNNINTTITEIDDSKKQDVPVEKEDKDISLNDTVTIDNNAPIYTNSYDASYNTNGYNALYDGSYDRIVEAVSYELDGKVYTVYRNEDNSYEKVDELIKNGATLTSVLVTRVDLANDITHEGYYNAANVRVRTR